MGSERGVEPEARDEQDQRDSCDSTLRGSHRPDEGHPDPERDDEPLVDRVREMARGDRAGGQDQGAGAEHRQRRTARHVPDHERGQPDGDPSGHPELLRNADEVDGVVAAART
jgi:hypothetical protein